MVFVLVNFTLFNSQNRLELSNFGCQSKALKPNKMLPLVTRKNFFISLCWCVLPFSFVAQTTIVWPPDISASCDGNLDDVVDLPVVNFDLSCIDSTIEFIDSYVETECGQDVVVDRTWTVTTCDSVYHHVQHIEFLDREAPYLFNSSDSEHFFSNQLDWLPLLQDNCDASLGGEITFSDTAMLCCGVMSFTINLIIPDDCGNELDTAYTVYLHELEPYLECDASDPEACGEGTTFDVLTGTCISLENCVPDSSFCGPNTAWNADLGLCLPATISSGCYFDTNSDGTVGSTDLLNFLSAYDQTCDGVE